MSHTMNVKTEIRDLDALYLACTRLGLKRESGEHRLFSSTETGTAVFLPGWSFPAIIRDDGTVAMDLYNGAWRNLSMKMRHFHKTFSVFPHRVSGGVC